MSEPYKEIEAAVYELETLRKTLKRKASTQVGASSETSLVKATVLAWFNSHRPIVSRVFDDELLIDVDNGYKALSAAADKSTTRSRYDGQLKSLRAEMLTLKEYALVPPAPTAKTDDAPPAFETLVPDRAMREVLGRRWQECARCISADAPLAATVMMGGLLETLLLARVHRHKKKGEVFGASSAPRDRRTGKTLQLTEWTLRNYIDVAHELGWISTSARDVGEVLRDYRNYVHPHKELSHGIALSKADASLFWQISKAISRQVLGGV
jgi:hypothetical protein